LPHSFAVSEFRIIPIYIDVRIGVTKDNI